MIMVLQKIEWRSGRPFLDGMGGVRGDHVSKLRSWQMAKLIGVHTYSAPPPPPHPLQVENDLPDSEMAFLTSILVSSFCYEISKKRALERVLFVWKDHSSETGAPTPHLVDFFVPLRPIQGIPPDLLKKITPYITRSCCDSIYYHCRFEQFYTYINMVNSNIWQNNFVRCEKRVPESSANYGDG